MVPMYRKFYVFPRAGDPCLISFYQDRRTGRFRACTVILGRYSDSAWRPVSACVQQPASSTEISVCTQPVPDESSAAAMQSQQGAYAHKQLKKKAKQAVQRQERIDFFAACDEAAACMHADQFVQTEHVHADQCVQTENVGIVVEATTQTDTADSVSSVYVAAPVATTSRPTCRLPDVPPSVTSEGVVKAPVSDAFKGVAICEAAVAAEGVATSSVTPSASTWVLADFPQDDPGSPYCRTVFGCTCGRAADDPIPAQCLFRRKVSGLRVLNRLVTRWRGEQHLIESNLSDQEVLEQSARGENLEENGGVPYVEYLYLQRLPGKPLGPRRGTRFYDWHARAFKDWMQNKY